MREFFLASIFVLSLVIATHVFGIADLTVALSYIIR